MRPLVACFLALAACSSSSSSTSTGGVTEDPGKAVKGCFDCAKGEYCIDVSSGSKDTYYCAPDGCQGECMCLMADAAKRHAECSSSCQTGSEMVFCAKTP